MATVPPKTVIDVPRLEKDFICKVCHRLVIVKDAKPWTIETEKEIIHTFDYGHRHIRTFTVIGKKQYMTEH